MVRSSAALAKLGFFQGLWLGRWAHPITMPHVPGIKCRFRQRKYDGVDYYEPPVQIARRILDYHRMGVRLVHMRGGTAAIREDGVA